MRWSTWNPFRPFGRQKTDVILCLKGVLAGSIDPREWGNFLDIPMNGTPELEAVRLACVALDAEESIDAYGVIFYTDKGRDKLQDLLLNLES